MNSDILSDLINRAMKAKNQAYAPYSNHPVGAAVLCEDGSVHVGANVENAAFPEGTCAEATAIGNMVLAGENDSASQRIKKVVVAGPGVAACTPCGGCRQKIREFAGTDVTVHMIDKDGNEILTCDFADLLPHSFGPDQIPSNT